MLKLSLIGKTGKVDGYMFETREDRVRLLKSGIDGRTIEKLYIKYNNFKIIDCPILFEINIFEFRKNSG